MIGKPAASYDGYSRHYARLNSCAADWDQAAASPERFAAREAWLPANRDARILDLGCGWGHQLLALWAAGYRALEGVEISPDQAKLAAAAAGSRAKITNADGESYLEGRKGEFDLVVMNDVLEHVATEATIRFLKVIKEALAAGGRLVVRVPNMASIAASFSHCIDVTHVTGYTEYSLQQVLENAGFETIWLVPDETGVDLSSWRPWHPLRGLGLRMRVNRLLHHIVYWARGQTPMPTVIGYNVTVVAEKRA
jgi:2-polyprenyl-3-methyl-5-hydroxy-6-metoxy-1,4-benzoquinol methylase